MIFIHTRLTDVTTLRLIQWLNYLGKDFFRLNVSADIMNELMFDMNTGTITFKDKIYDRYIDASTFDSFYLNNGHFLFPFFETSDPQLNSQLSENISNEIRTFWDYIYAQAIKKKQFGIYGYRSLNTNKLYILDIARKVGLDIPQTSLVSTKYDLISFKEKWGRIITKNIDYGVDIKTDTIMVSGQKTQEVTDTDIRRMDEKFAVTLIQQLVDKKFDIRVFYFRCNIYAIAIFNSAGVDCRLEDNENPGRKVPYTLPAVIEERISSLMQELELNYGCIDLLCTASNTYCFLEVNPFGQYGFLSEAGNFYIEKEIATYL